MVQYLKSIKRISPLIAAVKAGSAQIGGPASTATSGHGSGRKPCRYCR